MKNWLSRIIGHDWYAKTLVACRLYGLTKRNGANSLIVLASDAAFDLATYSTD